MMTHADPTTAQIAIVCPSRQRARKCLQMVNSYFSKAENPSRIYIGIGIDNDDPESSRYDQLLRSHPMWSNILYHMSPGGTRIGAIWNRMTEAFLTNNGGVDYIVMGNDEQIVETPNWDTVMVSCHQQTFPDGIGVSWCNDGINQGKHCAFPFVSRRWVETLGYFVPEGIFEFLCHDSWVFDIGKKLNRCHYVSDVLIEHHHWSQTKEKDATTKRHRDDTGNTRIPRDLKMFEDTDALRQEHAHKLSLVLYNEKIDPCLEQDEE